MKGICRKFIISGILVLSFGYSQLQCFAQEPVQASDTDPVLGFLLSTNTNESSWRIGGDLGAIRPFEMSAPYALSTSYAGHAGGLSLSGRYADYYREGGIEKEGSSFGSGLDATAWYAKQIPLPIDVTLRTRQFRWKLSLLEELSEQKMNLSWERWQTTLFSRLALKRLYMGAGIRLSPDDVPETITTATLEMGEMGALGLLWQPDFIEPAADMRWHEQQVKLGMTARREELTGWLRTPGLGQFHGEVLLNRHLWVRERGDADLPTLQPWGGENRHHAFIAFTSDGWRALGGIRGKELDLQAYGIQGDFPFAKVTACKFDLDSWFTSVRRKTIKRNDLLFELERSHFTGSGRGHVEFWPFTSGLADLLGLRRYFRANAEGKIWRYHAGWRHDEWGAWSTAAGVNLLDIHLDGVVTHWEPAYLVFGVKDLQTHRLAIYRALAGVLTFSIGYSRQSWKIGYSADQVIPIKTWHYGTDQEGIYPEEPVEDKRRRYGGGFHRLHVSWLFQ